VFIVWFHGWLREDTWHQLSVSHNLSVFITFRVESASSLCVGRSNLRSVLFSFFFFFINRKTRKIMSSFTHSSNIKCNLLSYLNILYGISENNLHWFFFFIFTKWKFKVDLFNLMSLDSYSDSNWSHFQWQFPLNRSYCIGYMLKTNAAFIFCTRFSAKTPLFQSHMNKYCT